MAGTRAMKLRRLRKTLLIHQLGFTEENQLARWRICRWAIFFVFLAGPIFAAPFDEIITFQQPDGTEIRLHGKGDEFYAEFTDLNGYTVVFDPATKTYYYAQLSSDGNDLIATGQQVGKVKPETLGLQKGLKINPAARAAKARKRYEEFEAVVKQEERWKAVKEASRNYHEFKKRVTEMEKAGKKGFAIPLGTIFPDSEIPSAPPLFSSPVSGDTGTGDAPIVMAPPSFTLSGDVVGLTILVDFPDVPGTVVTQAQVDDYCNKPNYTGFSNAGSVFDYYFIQSGGKLRYNNNVTYYVRVPNPKSYYNNTSVDCGTCGRLLLTDALNVLIANGYDFSKLTTKSGGNVRACNVFFAGANSGVWSYGLWPHRWVLSSPKSVGGGKYIYDYQITEIGTTASLKIGTFCHENGHMLLGYPDLYSYDGNAAEIGYYSLMASGNYGGSPQGTHPVNIDPYLKKASGWMDVIELASNSNQRCTVQVDGNQLYRYLNPAKTTEYFVFEVRDNTGYEGPYGGQTGSVNPSAGLVAYHVYETGSNPYSSIWTSKNPTNSYATPYELLLVEANQKTTITPWYDDPTPDSSDAFKSSGKSVISDTTTPELKFWVTSAATNGGGRMTASSCVITNISADSSNMTFVVGSGPLSGTPSIVLSRSTIYSYCGYGTDAASQTFTICNGQGGTLNYTITDDQPWLSCSPTNGTATTGNNLITVNFATSGLAAGAYTGTITVTDPAASPTTKTITVNLTVTPQPAITVAPATISKTGISGVSGPQTSFTINNTGGGSMNYTVSKTQSWLSLSPGSGTVVGETDTIYVNFDATSLAPGTYTDTITVTAAQAGNSPQTIPVTFTVQSSDMIVTAPNGGEQWGRGETRAITWVSSLGGNVKIELLKGGSLDATIVTNTPNDGTFDWAIPGTQVAATNYSVKITSIESPTKSDTSDANFSIIPTLADALDTTGLTWTNTGNLPWFYQTTTTKDGVDAAQSGAISDNQSSSIGTTLVGPGTMTFWWKVSSESGYDYLRFYLNGVEQTGSLAKISGTVDWTQKTVSIPAGTNTVTWTYSKDGNVSSGSDAAWLDMVQYSGAAYPEIAVEYPLGTNLVDGVSTVNFGSINVGSSSAACTFTIRNLGTTNLTGLALAMTGPHTNDYILGSLGTTALAPGSNTTFTVTFSPGAAGTRTATLQIASNDPDENPFDIALTGNGIGPGTLVVSPAGNFNSSGNYGGPFSPASTPYVLSNPGGTTINWTAGKSAAWVNLSATNGTLVASASATVTVAIATSANTLNVGNYNDTVAFTNTTNGSGDTTRGVSLTVNPLPATVTLGNLNQTYDGTPKSVSVTTTPNGLAHTVTYDGQTNLPVAAGTYTVVATVTQPNYAGSATGSLVIAKAPQTITFAALDPVLDNAPPFPLTATASSGLPVSYVSSNTAVATVSGNQVTIVGVGTTVITASQPGNQNYLPAPDVQQTLTVVRAYPLAVPGGPYKILFGQSLPLNGAASEPSYGETITAYDWDLNNDGTFGDVTGASNSVSYAALTGTWGMTEGVNTIQLRVTDSAGKTATNSATVEIVVGLTWDANGTSANRTDGAGAWLDANKWWDGSTNVSWATGASANFGNGGTGGAVTLASPTTVNTLVFNSFSGTYTLGTAGTTITINGGIIKNAGSGAATIASPVALGADQTWLNTSANLLTTGNATNLVDNAGYQLTIDGAGNFTLGVINNTNAALTGSGALVKTGTGVLALGGKNDGFTGQVTVSGGVLRVNSPASITGNLNLANGVYEHYWSDAYTRTLGTGPQQIQITGGVSGFSENGSTNVTFTLNNSTAFELVWGDPLFRPAVFVLQADTAQGNSSLTLANKLDLNGTDRTIQVSGGTTGAASATIAGAIRNTTGTAGLIKTGAGKLILSGANTYNGGTTINAGTLSFNSIAAMPPTGTVAVQDGAVLGIKLGGTGNWSAGTSGVGTLGGLLAGLGGAGTSTVTYAGNVGLLLDVAATTTYSGTITNVGTALTLQKSGASALTLSGNNSYTGDTILLGGTLTAGSAAALGSAGNITFKGGTLQYTNASAAVDFGPRIKNSTSAIALDANGQTVTLTGIDSSNTGGLTVTAGTGLILLAGTNTYTGATTVSSGRLIIQGSLSNVAGTLTVAAGATLGGTGTIGRNVTIANGGQLAFNISTNAANHDALDIAAGRNFAFAGASVLTITSSGGAATGTYTLVTGGNNITGSAPATVNLPTNWAATVSISGNSLLLNVTSAGATTYLLTVNNGTGGGRYAAGTAVPIAANAPAPGYHFVNWTTADGGSFADANAASTTYTMPANPATVTANYAENTPLTITAASATKMYDGTPLTNAGYSITAGSLNTGHSLVSVTVTGAQTVAGTAANVPRAAIIHDGSGHDVTDQYAITYANGTLTVTPRPITITAASATKVYDGTPLTNAGYSITAGSLADGDALVSVTVVGSRTEVGSTNNVPSAATITNGRAEDVTASYAITYAPGTLTVIPPALKITAATATMRPGVANALTIQLVNPQGAPVTGLSGDYELTFSGLATAGDGTRPTVTDKHGFAVALGQPTVISFVGGESAAGGALVAYRAEGPVTLHASSGGATTTNAGGAGVSLTIVNEAPVAAGDLFNRSWNSPLQVAKSALASNDTDANRDLLTVTGVTTPSVNGATVTINGDYVVYDSTNNVSDAFHYTISDGQGGVATGTVAVTVGAQPLMSAVETGFANGRIRLVFRGIYGLHYMVARSQTITGPFEPLAGFTDITITDPQGRLTVEDTPPAGWTSAFYRLQWLGR